eukprot:jgi/Botrbrau1/3751/Bobra.0363s0028.1
MFLAHRYMEDSGMDTGEGMPRGEEGSKAYRGMRGRMPGRGALRMVGRGARRLREGPPSGPVATIPRGRGPIKPRERRRVLFARPDDDEEEEDGDGDDMQWEDDRRQEPWALTGQYPMRPENASFAGARDKFARSGVLGTSARRRGVKVTPSSVVGSASSLPYDEEDDVDMVGPEHDTGGRTTYRPGRVVWAKVEGHDWWPARVVRRRAVPREVGPPPGGATEVHSHIPVVFFTASGIPGEANEGLRSSQMDAEPEEAEYAWLPVDALRNFVPVPMGCKTLRATSVMIPPCVRPWMPPPTLSDNYVPTLEPPQNVLLVTTLTPPTLMEAGVRTSPSRGRGFRGKRDEDEDDDSDNGGGVGDMGDGFGTGGSVPSVPVKVQVENILGWRHPLGYWDSERGVGRQSRQDGSDGGEERAAYGRAWIRSPVVKEEGIEQSEAEAVAALLAWNQGEPADTAPRDDEEGERQILVKYVGRSHIHNDWLDESVVQKLAKRKLMNFNRRYGRNPCNFQKEEWVRPERLVDRRRSPSGPGWEVLVKWSDLGYDHCTWEAEAEGLLARSDYKELHEQLWSRGESAMRRARTESREQAASARKKAGSVLPPITAHPPYIKGATLAKHQLEGLNWLRRMWVKGEGAILADAPGLGKTGTVVSFIQCLRHEFHLALPVLIIVPSTMLAFWEGEWAFWAGNDCNVVAYAGSTSARSIIAENELWLSPGCLDGRGAYKYSDHHAHKVVKAEVVLMTYEALQTDLHLITQISWEMVVLDERNRKRAGKQAAAPSIIADALPSTRHRLLISQGRPLEGTAQALLDTMSFVCADIDSVSISIEDLPEHEKAWDVRKHFSVSACSHEPSGTLTYYGKERKEIRGGGSGAQVATRTWKPLFDLGKYAACSCGDAQEEVPGAHHASEVREEEVGAPVPQVRCEVVLPCPLTPNQAEAYRATLVRHYPTLTDPKPPRHAGHHAGQIRGICANLCKVCNHPALVGDTDTDDEPAEEGADASGKLLLLNDLLPRLRQMNHHLLLLSKDPRALDMVEMLVKRKFGENSYVRTDHSQPSEQRYAAFEQFNRPSSSAFLFLMTSRATGLGTYLPHVRTVILHDSEWEPRHDLAAIARARCIGESSPLLLLRLLVRGTAEERILSLAEKHRGLDALFESGPGRRSSAGNTRVLEDVLRWGTADLFADSPPKDLEGELDGRYAATTLDKILDAADHALKEGDEGDAGPRPLLPSVPQVTVRWWGESRSPDDDADDEGEEGGEEEGDEEEAAEAVEEPSRQESAATSAEYWTGLLREPYLRVQQEQEEGPMPARPEDGETNADSDGSYGEELDEVSMEGTQRAGQNYEYVVGEEIWTRSRGGRGRGRSRGGLGAGSGRGMGRGARRRRLEEDDAMVNGSTDDVRHRNKRRKGLEAAPHGQEGLHHLSGALQEELRMLREQHFRFQVLVDNANSPQTLEGGIFLRACARIKEFCLKMGYPDAVVILCHQAAMLLLAMRPDNEETSDFQDYTLVAIVCMSAHLQGLLPESEVAQTLHFMTNKFCASFPSEPSCMQTVYDHIKESLEMFKARNLRYLQLMGLTGEDAQPKAVPEPNLAKAWGGGGVVPRPHQDPPMDNFTQRINQIISADKDLEAIAMGMGPFDNASSIPGPPEAVQKDKARLDQYEKIVRTMTDHLHRITMLDRIHGLKVKNIQEEYQKYMELVRSKAQTAIDEVNHTFESSRAQLTLELDGLVRTLDQNFFNVLSGPRGPGPRHPGDVPSQGGRGPYPQWEPREPPQGGQEAGRLMGFPDHRPPAISGMHARNLYSERTLSHLLPPGHKADNGPFGPGYGYGLRGEEEREARPLHPSAGNIPRLNQQKETEPQFRFPSNALHGWLGQGQQGQSSAPSKGLSRLPPGALPSGKSDAGLPRAGGPAKPPLAPSLHGKPHQGVEQGSAAKGVEPMDFYVQQLNRLGTSAVPAANPAEEAGRAAQVPPVKLKMTDEARQEVASAATRMQGKEQRSAPPARLQRPPGSTAGPADAPKPAPGGAGKEGSSSVSSAAALRPLGPSGSSGSYLKKDAIDEEHRRLLEETKKQGPFIVRPHHNRGDNRPSRPAPQQFQGPQFSLHAKEGEPFGGSILGPRWPGTGPRPTPSASLPPVPPSHVEASGRAPEGPPGSRGPASRSPSPSPSLVRPSVPSFKEAKLVDRMPPAGASWASLQPRYEDSDEQRTLPRVPGTTAAPRPKHFLPALDPLPVPRKYVLPALNPPLPREGAAFHPKLLHTLPRNDAAPELSLPRKVPSGPKPADRNGGEGSAAAASSPDDDGAAASGDEEVPRKDAGEQVIKKPPAEKLEKDSDAGLGREHVHPTHLPRGRPLEEPPPPQGRAPRGTGPEEGLGPPPSPFAPLADAAEELRRQSGRPESILPARSSGGSQDASREGSAGPSKGEFAQRVHSLSQWVAGGASTSRETSPPEPSAVVPSPRRRAGHLGEESGRDSQVSQGFEFGDAPMEGSPRPMSRSAASPRPVPPPEAPALPTGPRLSSIPEGDAGDVATVPGLAPLGPVDLPPQHGRDELSDD